MKYPKTILCVYLILQTSYLIASTAYTKDVVLPKKERQVLEDLVCVKPHNVKAAIIQGSKDVQSALAFDSALVQCQAHDEFHGQPMHYQAGCSFSNKQWQCNPAGLEVIVSIQGRRVTMQPWGLSPEVAYQILNKISTYGSFQTITMSDAIGSHCHVSPLKDGETIELNCASIITVSNWCPQPTLAPCPRVVYVTPQPAI